MIQELLNNILLLPSDVPTVSSDTADLINLLRASTKMLESMRSDATKILEVVTPSKMAHQRRKSLLIQSSSRCHPSSVASPFHPNLIGATLCRLRRYQSPGVLSVQIDKPTIKSIVNEVIDEHPTIQRMANKIGDLDTRIGGLDTRIGGLDTRIGDLDTRIGDLDTRIGGLDTRIGDLDTRIGGLDTRVGRLETDVSELKSELKVHARTTNYSINQLHNSVHKLNLTMDDMKSDIKKVLEIVIPSKKREEQFDQMEHRVEEHDHRIGALEDAVKA